MQKRRFIQAFKDIFPVLLASESVAYKNCSELPLYNLIKILSTGDLKWLIISGKPKNLSEIWEAIMIEYAELSKNTRQNYLLLLLKEIAYINNKLFIIQSLVDELMKKHSPELVAHLQSQGFMFKYDPSDWDRYVKDLRLTISQSKTMLLKVKDRERELKTLQETLSEGGVKESDYDVILSDLSKYQGYRLNPREISVSEYLAILNRYKDHVKPRKN